MLRELKSLASQLNWIGLTVKADHIDLLIRSIAGENPARIDGEIELAVSELVRTAKRGESNKISNEISELLMLHSDYSKFASDVSIERDGKLFKIKSFKAADSPEKAIAFYITGQKEA